MTKEIIIYTDYVCPFCLLAAYVIQKEINNSEVKIRWRLHELRPFPVETLRVEDEYLPSIWESSVYPMAEKLNIPIRLPAISPQPRTAKAFEAFFFAEHFDLGDEFSMAVLSAFFQQGLDIGDISVLSDIGAGVGLKRDELEDALVNSRYKEDYQKAFNHALYEAKVKVVPTIIIGEDKYEGVPEQAWVTEALSNLTKNHS